jgi:hypothetical protein
MSVMNRKMFANRDARNKLAGMGGILASSPELMGATQRFQDGGVSTPRGVPDSPRLSESLESSAPIATIGGKSFFLSEDGGYIVDAEGSVVRDPSVLSAVMQQVLPQTQPQEGFIPPEVASEPRADTFAGIEDVGLDAREAALQNAGRMTAEEKMMAELSDASARRTPESEAFPDRAPELNNALGLDDARAERGFGRTATMDGLQVPFDTTSEVMPAENQVTISPELPPEGIMATIAALASADDTRKNEILFPSYDPNNRGGPEEFQPEISPEMAEQLRVLEQRRTSRAIAEGAGDLAKGAGQGAVTGARFFNDALNVGGGYLADTGLTGLSLGANALGYVTGGGDVSAALFNAGNSLSDAADTFTPEGNLLPRLFNGAETEAKPDPDLEAERLAQIEMDSLRNISDAMVAGDESLFSEGAPVESLGDDLPDSVIQARKMEPPVADSVLSDPSFGDDSMLGEESGFNVPVGEMPVESSEASSPPAYDTSTGGPLTMDEVSERVLIEREQAADAGLTNTQEQGDRFPQEDARIAAQEAALSEIRTRRLSDQEREQMAYGNEYGTGLTIEDAPDAAPGAVINEGALESSLRPQSRPDPESSGDAEFAPIITKIKEKPGDAGAIVSEAMLDGSGVDTSNMGVKERTVAMKKMLNDLMGQTDADEKEEFWMNMAMIGFGIASGDSPDAMKNIADGLLAGTAQITKGKADKKARDDKFTLTAFGEVLADERAREKFARDQVLAGIRASGESSFSTPDRMYKSTYDAILGSYKRAIEDGDMTEAEAVRKASQIASEAYPNSQFSKPDPAVTSLIQTQRKLGKSDAEIKKMMIEANQNPALYGI